MEYKIRLTSENLALGGVKSKIEYSASISKTKFDKIYSILKNEDN